MEYETIFWANSSDSGIAFLLPKKILRIMTGSKLRDSCNPAFQTLDILTVPSQYLLSLMTSLIHNLEFFTFHSSIHSISTIRTLQKHRPSYFTFHFIFGIKLYMFRTVPLPIIRSFSLYTQQWYVIQVCCLQAVSKPVSIAVCTVKNSWWWTEELSKTCRVLFQK